MTPSRHWHWLPYLALASTLIGPIGLAGGVTVVERWLLHLLLAVVSAWFLVPTWASLQPLRGAYVILLTAVVFLLSTLLDPLPARLKDASCRGCSPWPLHPSPSSRRRS